MAWAGTGAGADTGQLYRARCLAAQADLQDLGQELPRVHRQPDSAMRLGVPGLSMFQMDKSKAVWADWREWPHLAIPHDQGSDQQCGVNALIYHYKLNSDRYPDGDHQAQRSVWQVLHATDLYPFWMLMTTAWNFVDGPDKNSYRWRQLAEATTDVREQSSARTNAASQT